MELAPSTIAPTEEANALQFLDTQSRLESNADGCWIMFAIERVDDGDIIGEVGMYIEAEAKRAGDIGWSLRRDACGQGYAIEAAKRLVDYAFGERGLLSLTASMSAYNVPSIRVCERLGMHRKSTAAKAQRVGSDWHDVHQYVLAKGDWTATLAVRSNNLQGTRPI